jgi:hypothetical protein
VKPPLPTNLKSTVLKSFCHHISYPANHDQTFTLDKIDLEYGESSIPFTQGALAQNGDITVTLLGVVISTHGTAMGVRTLMPAVSFTGT